MPKRETNRMISAEFVGGPWCGDVRGLPPADFTDEIEVYGCIGGEPPINATPDQVPAAYLAGTYAFRPNQTHAGPYWYDWRPA